MPDLPTQSTIHLEDGCVDMGLPWLSQFLWNALDSLDAAFAAVDATCSVVLMNELAEVILRRGDGITILDGRLAATDSFQSNQLEHLLKWQ